MRPMRSNPHSLSSHPASTSSLMAEQRVTRAIQESHRSEQAGGAPANSTGARRLECKWQAPACDSGLTTRDAPEPETPFFGLFLFSLLSSATCALSDHLPMNVRGRLVSARERVGGHIPQAQQHAHMRHAIARASTNAPGTAARALHAENDALDRTGRKRARLAEDELDRTSV